jgi:hypothetical protein
VLLDDPRDLVAFGAAVTDLLGADGRCQQIAQAARERVLAEYLAPTYLARQLVLVGAVAN